MYQHCTFRGTNRRFLVNKYYSHIQQDMGGWFGLYEGIPANINRCTVKYIGPSPQLAYNKNSTARVVSTQGRECLELGIVSSRDIFVTRRVGLGKWLSASAYVFAWSVIGRLMVRASSVPFSLTIVTIQSLSECHQLAPTTA